MDLFVNQDVLIPRIDTELLVEKAIETIQAAPKSVYYFDIGTGSGCIPVGVFSQVSEKIEHAFLFEISAGAMKVAQINVEKFVHPTQVSFFVEDFHRMSEMIPDVKLDTSKEIVITANLPYIKIHDIFLDKDVLDHEPTVALFGWRGTGFELYDDFFEILFALKSQWIFSKLTVLIEIGYDQFEVSKDFLSKKNLNFEYFRDTGYHDRVIKIHL